MGQVRNREEEDLIKTLYAQVKDLKIKNAKLTKDNEKITEQYERKKREVSILSKGKKASAPPSMGASIRKSSPERPASSTRSATAKSSALTESKEVDIRAASARRSQDVPLVRPGAPLSASIAARDESLLQITQALQSRYDALHRCFPSKFKTNGVLRNLHRLNNTEDMLIRAKEENATLRTRLAAIPNNENAARSVSSVFERIPLTTTDTESCTVKYQF